MTGHASTKAPQLVACFQPEAWVGDYAIPCDPDGPTEWDPLPTLQAEHGDLLPEILAACASDGDWLDFDDLLKSDPNAPAWIRDWPGPSTITVRLAAGAAAEPESDQRGP